ncbi:MAG: RsmB/NOP family class I SAM-dependent RNA methyltransferase [Chloroherpetonaceae bacterium]|nr:RsmB/NOP family class I SAM-dependent RNA methyltransferase [Chthonomonadaceae bacterium]MDW8208089.1 RsmB/NOP family class I SAM-dependent RNA methyltransferase [Chloroherpetonaceae bacterium]
MPELTDSSRGATPRALHAAIEIFARWQQERERTPLDRCVDAEFRARRYLNAGERRWTGEAVYGSVRHLRRQSWLIARLGLVDTPEVRIRLWAAAPVRPDGSSPEILQPFCQHPQMPAPERLHAALRALPRAEEAAAEYMRIALSFPDAMVAELEALLPAEAVTAAQSFNMPAPTTLRVNTWKVSRRRVEDVLAGATPTFYSPWGLHLPGRVHLPSLPGFRDGWFEVQEEASQLVALATDARPGQTVVDACAGAGGKSLALAAMLGGRGRVIALDVSVAKLRELQRRAARAGVTRWIQVCPVRVSERGDWICDARMQRMKEQLQDGADCVLLDAPCTGSGVLRRNPDAKWRVWNMEAMTQRQMRLLEQCASLVRPGGCLLYATCALERWQNEAIVSGFLESSSGASFVVEPVAQRLRRALRRQVVDQPVPDPGALIAGPFLRTFPHRGGLDAFFAVCLRRARRPYHEGV